jgi:hypothetical protein
MTTILQSASLDFREDNRRLMVRKQGDTITGIISCNGEPSLEMRLIGLARTSVFVQQRRSSSQDPESVSFKSLIFSFMLPCLAGAAEFHVSPTGDDGGTGSADRPFASIGRAQQVVKPGDTVWLHGGTYRMSEAMIAKRERIWAHVIHLHKSGLPGKPISYRAVAGARAVFDFSAVKPAEKRVHAFQVSGSYLWLQGFEVCGVQVTKTGHTQSVCISNTGSHNVFERLSMRDGMGIGFYLSRGKNNLILNCDAWNNHDPVSGNGRGGNVDGFGAHPRPGDTGNVFRGCRAWFNADDGFDCIAAGESVRLEECWAFQNGLAPDGKHLADGNGFKVGGYDRTPIERLPRPIPRHVVVRCVAAANKMSGFYANHHPGGGDWIHNTAFANRRANFNFLCRKPGTFLDVPGFGHVIRNNLGFRAHREVANLDPAACEMAGNLFGGDALDSRDFLSVDPAALGSPRQSDGSLPKLSFMRPAPDGRVIDRGVLIGEPFAGRAPEPGAFEAGPQPARK